MGKQKPPIYLVASIYRKPQMFLMIQAILVGMTKKEVELLFIDDSQVTIIHNVAKTCSS